MSADGVGNFDNDDAMDWAFDLEQVKNNAFIEETLKVVTERGDEYLEAPEAYRALAAAEVVAALKHGASSGLPIEVKQWVSKYKQRPISSNLTQLALKAIQRIQTASELKELWEETDYAADWYEVLDDLEVRLKG
jgi:HJR/Mrr/RecB family endonuclease